MLYRAEDPWEDAILFPVEQKRVFVETESGPRRTTRYKAIVNGDTGATIAVVSDRYRVLENRDALHLGILSCTMAYPHTEEADWEVTRVEAPSTGGHCHVDLRPRRSDRVPAYDWMLAPEVLDRFEPRIRVQNGYNGRTAFKISVCLLRKVCGNLALVRTVKVYHDKGMRAEIARAFRPDEVQATMEGFRRRLERLTAVVIPRDHFEPIIRRALKIRPPKQHDEHSSNFERAITSRSDRYAKELGTTAYALWAAITDLATRPPGNRIVRRGPSSLQWLADRWLREFDNAIRAPSFDVSTYVEKLSDLPSQDG